MKDMIMDLDEKQDEGYPQARFNEVNVTSAKSRRGPLFYKATMSVFIALAMSGVAFGTQEVRSDGVTRIYS